jgi:glyoxylase-like metal-dependent hydrolase (beta-lactamase superfamily II)
MRELTALGDGIHCLRGGVNSGLVETDRGLVVVDTGLDRSAANRIVRAAEALGRPLVAIVNTHAHADHHGGNAHLVRRLALPVHAPAVEEAVIREPRYEPIYLFGGASPVRALENRFLQAEPSPVDHVFRPDATISIDGREVEVLDLAGHTVAQVGVRVGEVLFAADSFFGLEPLRKHGVPYLVDAGRARDTLRTLAGSAHRWYVPGHGEPLDEPGPTLEANRAVIDRVLDRLRERLRERPAGTDDLLAELAPELGLVIGDATSFVLYRTTLLGYLSTLEREGEIHVVIEAGHWLWVAA